MPNTYGNYDISVPSVAPGSGSWLAERVTRRGELRVIDFFTEMLMEGRGFQVRSGTIATGIAAQNVIADQTADMCIDAASGLTIIPVSLHAGFRDVATATTLQVALKAVGSASTAGTAFVPLPLRQGGAASSSTARVAADGVTVAAEAVTTTRRLFESEVLQTQSATVLAVGQLVSIQAAASQLRYIGDGVACIYLQVASTTAFTLHFSTLDYIELLTTSIG